MINELQVWHDDAQRSGPENMALDEWLWSICDAPLLRVYGWQKNWCSIGYFSNFKNATSHFPEKNFVRRITGGGMVNHDSDWTYSLIYPPLHEVSKMRGAASYAMIHTAVQRALLSEKIHTHSAHENISAGGEICFLSPVAHDLVNEHDAKIAGAGQKRGKHGLLHQGSISIPAADSRARTAYLANELADKFHYVTPDVSAIEVNLLITKYSSQEWTQSHRKNAASQ